MTAAKPGDPSGPPPHPDVAPMWTLRGSMAFRRINAALFMAVQPLLPIFADTDRIGAAQSSLAIEPAVKSSSALL